MSTQSSTHTEEFNRLVGKLDWIEIAAVAYHFHLAHGRGVIQLSDTGEPENYIIAGDIVNDQVKTHLKDYNPHTMVIIQHPIDGENITGLFLPQIPPEVAKMIHQSHRTRKDGIYHGKNSTRLIRIADIKFYEGILQVALEITQKLYETLTVPCRRDVLHLAIRLIGQAQTLYHLGSPLMPPVPGLGDRESVLDLSSISSIFRTIIETFLTMHEVFFEPKDENDFDFFYSRWMLIGLHNIRKHTPDSIYSVYASEEVEPMRINATQRIKRTTQYKAMLLMKKNDHEKALKALVHRNRDIDEWQRIAQSANIDISAYQKMYSAYSGYIHSDGYTSFSLAHDDAFEFDLHVELLLFLTTRLISKMIYNFAEKYEDADRIARANKRLYPIIKHYSRKVEGDGN